MFRGSRIDRDVASGPVPEENGSIVQRFNSSMGRNKCFL